MSDSNNDPVYVTEALIAEDIDAYLEQHQHKTMLRFITCGSVDDGKSTLIGRLLYEAKMLFEDQLSALEADSRKMGTQGGNLDFALLVQPEVCRLIKDVHTLDTTANCCANNVVRRFARELDHLTGFVGSNNNCLVCHNCLSVPALYRNTTTLPDEVDKLPTNV